MDSLDIGTNVGIFEVVEEASDMVIAAFSERRPPSGEDADRREQVPRNIERAYVREFKEPFEAALDSMLSGGEADQSPIIESITALGVRVGDVPCSTEKSCRLWIVSDMLQNSVTFDFYEGIKDLGAAIRPEWVPDLRRLAS